MDKKEFAKIWTEMGKKFIEFYETRHGTDILPFNSIVPEYRADGSVSFHLAYLEPKEEKEDIWQDQSKEPKEELKVEHQEEKKLTPEELKELRLKNLSKGRKKEELPEGKFAESSDEDDEWEE